MKCVCDIAANWTATYGLETPKTVLNVAKKIVSVHMILK